MRSAAIVLNIKDKLESGIAIDSRRLVEQYACRHPGVSGGVLLLDGADLIDVDLGSFTAPTHDLQPDQEGDSQKVFHKSPAVSAIAPTSSFRSHAVRVNIGQHFTKEKTCNKFDECPHSVFNLLNTGYDTPVLEAREI
jgi:hypothetical protein